MTGRRSERAFAVLAALALVATGLAAATAGTTDGADRADDVSFDPQVPDEYAFDPPMTDGTAVVDGERFDDLDAALAAASSGDTVRLHGRFDVADPVVVETADLTIRGADGLALIDGDGEGRVLAVNASNVTLRRLWVRNAGYDAGSNDAAVWLDGAGASVVDSRVTETTFGIWVDGVSDVRIENTTIVGREAVRPLSERGNGIQLWEATGAVVVGNRITDVRDGIYFSWASGVAARDNTMWDLRYGVHYMYSDRCLLANNTAFDNDVGYALMVSRQLRILDNRAVNNTGRSGHGILVKSVDHSVIRGNDLVGNDNGVYVYNSLNNTLANNVVAANDVGVHLTAGSVEERVTGNTFLDNGLAVKAVVGEQVAWNDSGRGNYWAGAVPADVDEDGVAETRHKPAGLVQRIVATRPAARIFAGSPAFEAVRVAESSLPVVESPGVVDHRPLVDPPTDRWRRYYGDD